MKQNIYDDENFFEAYKNFPRSVKGLTAAGEWHELQRLLPELGGKRVLDIGCGFGWHCTYAAEQGAAYVLGTDISEKMLAVAREKTGFANVEYRRVAMEDLELSPGSFDVVLSSLALHYTPDLGLVCRKVFDSLKPGGSFIFSAEHPVFTAEGRQDWAYDAEGRHAHWPVDRYFEEGARDATFLGEQVVKYHRTLTTYLGTLLQAGFTIDAVVEPQPAAHLLEVPGMKEELRRPMMLLVKAGKPAL